MYPQFKKLLESFDTDFDKQWKHTGTDFNKIKASNRDEYGGDEIGREYSNGYELETYLQDGSQLKINVYFSYCDLDDEQDPYIEHYLDNILYVGFEVYYGKKKIPDVYDPERRSKLDPEEYDLSATWKTSPYSSYKKDYEKKLNDIQKELENLSPDAPNYKWKKNNEEHYLKMLNQPAYSHSDVANIVIGAIVNLVKKMAQKYKMVVLDYNTEHNKQRAEKVVNKIAAKCGFYHMNVSNDYDIRSAIKFADRLGLEYFNIYNTNGWFLNVSDLNPIERLEKKKNKELDELF
jgi:hypothetical protein